MSLSKIVSVKNVGRFLNSLAVGDVVLRRYNFVFAENGRGKTTLCAILRSLQSGEPAHILGRHTLGSTDQPEVRLLLDGNRPVTFRAGTWSEILPQLSIFDGTFISENVHAGDAVDTAQRRNLYRVIVGSHGVVLARRIEDLDGQVRAKNTEIREVSAAVQRHVPDGMNIETFMNLPADPAVEESIVARDRELQSVSQADVIGRRALLSSVDVPEIQAGFSDLLRKTLRDVEADAERLLADHIARHEMSERGEAWLSEGMQYIRDESCPFCDQRISGLPVLRAYQAVFSDAYHVLREEITTWIRDVTAGFGDRVIGGIERTVEQNAVAVEFWQQYCTLDAPLLRDPRQVTEALTELRGAALSLLERKAAAPLQAFQLDAAFERAIQAFEQARAEVATYNAAIQAANTVIEAKKRDAGGADLHAAREALARVRAQKARHTREVNEICIRHGALYAERAELERQKNETREQLDQYTAQVIQQYGESINRYLDHFNAGFQIATLAHSYRGGVASSSYQILINQTPVDLGGTDTPLDRPSFKNTLSAGDRSALALAFFLAQIEHDPERNERIVVFDDPFTSQDGFRRNNTAFQIKRIGENCSQVVLLSHDPYFLKLVWDKLTIADRKALQLTRVGEGNTSIAEWDIETAVQARYKAELDALQKYIALREGESREVVQKIRPVLEGYCQSACPTQFLDGDTLGVMVGKIRTAGATHPLHGVAGELDEINDYCRRYHHAENPGAAAEPLEDNELSGYVGRTLRVAGCY